MICNLMTWTLGEKGFRNLKGGFKLHKWHSSEQNLETKDLSSQIDLNFAKEHLGTKANESKLLGLNWDKQRDIFKVKTLTESQLLTKRNVIKTLASIYHLLEFRSSVLLIGKLLFQNFCFLRIPCDSKKIIQNKSAKWIKGPSIKIEITKSISIRGTITNIDIHLISDASIAEACKQN